MSAILDFKMAATVWEKPGMQDLPEFKDWCRQREDIPQFHYWATVLELELLVLV